MSPTYVSAGEVETIIALLVIVRQICLYKSKLEIDNTDTIS